MAITTIYNDRLDRIAYRHYGAITSDAMRALIVGNPVAARVLAYPEGITLETPPAIAFNPSGEEFRWLQPPPD